MANYKFVSVSWIFNCFGELVGTCTVYVSLKLAGLILANGEKIAEFVIRYHLFCGYNIKINIKYTKINIRRKWHC